jgi:aspartate/methionine/tyrosine aminotransferase
MTKSYAIPGLRLGYAVPGSKRRCVSGLGPAAHCKCLCRPYDRKRRQFSWAEMA